MRKDKRPLIEGKNGKYLLRVPDEILLRQADKLISKLRQTLGENESYIAELEDKVKKLEIENKVLKNDNDYLREGIHETTRDVKQSEPYRALKKNNDNLTKKIKIYSSTISDLIIRIHKLEENPSK